MLRKFSEITNNKQIFSQYNFFYKMNISFFNLRFGLFLIINKEVNQMRNNVVCVKAGLNIVFCCALTTGCCNAFQHYFRKTKSEFYGPYFQAMFFLVTMLEDAVFSKSFSLLRDFFNRYIVIFFETSLLKEVRILRYIHKNSAVLILRSSHQSVLYNHSHKKRVVWKHGPS